MPYLVSESVRQHPAWRSGPRPLEAPTSCDSGSVHDAFDGRSVLVIVSGIALLVLDDASSNSSRSDSADCFGKRG